jgi:hypothetical protein
VQTVTLRAEDFRTVHNTLCELREVEQSLNSVINEQMAHRLHRVVKGFESGLADAYQQDKDAFDTNMDYYTEFQRENGLKSIWSIYDLPVHGFLQDHPFPSDAFVVYTQHWGDVKYRHYPVQGTTWADVYRAADLAIRGSGDDHHIFIERFLVKNGNELHLTTGS